MEENKNDVSQEKEENKESEEIQENKTSNQGETKETGDIVAEAKEAARIIREQNDRKEKFLDREEKLVSRQEALNALGGGSYAGQKNTEPKEVSDVQYAEKALSGEMKKE